MTFSVRGRLTLWYLSVLGLSLVLFEFVVYLSVKESIANMIDANLEAKLTATSDFLEEHIKTDPPGELQDEFQEYSASRPGGELLQISDASGAWIFRSASLRRFAIPPPRVEARTAQLRRVSREKGRKQERKKSGKAKGGKSWKA